MNTSTFTDEIAANVPSVPSVAFDVIDSVIEIADRLPIEAAGDTIAETAEIVSAAGTTGARRAAGFVRSHRGAVAVGVLVAAVGATVYVARRRARADDAPPQVEPMSSAA